MNPEIVAKAIPEDERVWVPQAPGVCFRPLMLNTVNGGWFNLLRVRKVGSLSSSSSISSFWLCSQRFLEIS